MSDENDLNTPPTALDAPAGNEPPTEPTEPTGGDPAPTEGDNPTEPEPKGDEPKEPEPKGEDAPPAEGDDPKEPEPKGDDEGDDEPPKMPEWNDLKKAIAGEDEKLLKKLDRYNSLADFGKAHSNLVQRLSSGDFAEKLPEDATEEQVKEWREKNGVPAEPDGYMESLPEGLVLGEADQNILNGVLFSAHEANIPANQMQSILEGYQTAQETEVNRIMENDARVANEVQSQLKEEWGDNYTTYNNQLNNFLKNQFGEDVTNLMLAARLSDENRTPMFSHPDVINKMTQVAKIMNPNATNTGYNEGSLQTVTDRIKEIEEVMHTKPSKYFKDTDLQQELKDLYEAEMKMTPQSDAA